MSNLSQYQLSSKLTGVGRDRVSRLENGYATPSAEERQMIEGVLNQVLAEQLDRMAELRPKDKRPTPKTSDAEITLTL